ncbi:hypothetical protein UFOVP136_22 [uncultured Caudovirales phage]|uniref:Uncharacterized protein n=1 Tax=uncultured Caudovirales phage TaxID=2100421 RepID=A0A6J5LK89_9CAUD|nr:hypothetical protein UFOVP136_22 [uncultured Caudovirales phage]
MSVTHPTASIDAANNAVTALIGASGKLKVRLAGTVGAPGTAVATLSLSATAFAASSAGVSTANAITSDTNATGNASPVATATLETSGGTVVIHFDVAAQVSTSVTGSSGAATVTVGSATGIIVGQIAAGTGIATNARVVNINGTTITLSANNTGAVSGTGTFTSDMTMTSTGGLTVNAGDTVSCSSMTYKAIGA